MNRKLKKLIDKLNYEIEFYNLRVADYNRESMKWGKVYGKTWVYLYDQAERVESAALELKVYCDNELAIVQNNPKLIDFMCKLYHANVEGVIHIIETNRDKVMKIHDIAAECRIYLGDSQIDCDRQFETIDKYSK